MFSGMGLVLSGDSAVVVGSAGGGVAAAEAFSGGEVGGGAGATGTFLASGGPSGETIMVLPLALNTIGLLLFSMSIWAKPNLRALARYVRFIEILTGKPATWAGMEISVQSSALPLAFKNKDSPLICNVTG